MENVPIPVLLLVSEDAGMYAGLGERLADRGFEMKMIPVHEQASWLVPPLSERWRQILAGRRLARRLGEDHPVLIHAIGHASADPALELALRWKRPYLLSIPEFLNPGDRLRLARRWCRGVIVSGEQLAEDLIRHLGVPSRLLKIVRPGILPGPIRLSPPSRPWLPVVGTAVGADLGSGLATFLDAARMVLASGVEAEFVLAELGSGTTLARRLADGLAIAHRLTITEGIELGRSFWPVLDVYVHAPRQPSSGRALLSALSHGIPSIASEVPGLRDLADSGRTARIVPPGDAPALAAEILSLLADRASADELGRRGREHIVAEYSPDREADALAMVYRAAIASSEGVVVRHRSDASQSVVASRRS